MRELQYLILFLHISSVAMGQSRIEKYVQENANRISSISPDSTNYDDLEAIGKAVGDARIVLLGEEDHGDAPTFLAKTRLVRYLHERRGFNVLAFESDFFALNEGWDGLIKNRAEIDSFLRENVLSLWAFCNTCSSLLYHYIPFTYSSHQPLIITGFDNQMVYKYSRTVLIRKMDSVLKSLKIPVTTQANYNSEIIPSLDSLITISWYKRTEHSYFLKCDNILEEIRIQVAKKLPADSFWWILINNLMAFNEEMQDLSANAWHAESIRDRQMYFNLKWLTKNKYPGQKMIIWAANNHIAKYSTKNYTSMGYLLANDTSLNLSSYAIGFTAYSGASGRLWEPKYIINNPKRNSFESWINPALNYAFIDFKAYNKEFPDAREKFNLRWARYRPQSNKWYKIFDGIFYIKDMYPCQNR